MRFTIKAKLALAFGLILALMGVAGYFSIVSLGGSNDRMQSFAARPFAQVQRVLQLETIAVDSARLLARSMVTPSDADRAKLHSEFKGNDAKFQTMLKDFVDLLPVEKRSAAQPLTDAWGRQVNAAQQAFELALKNGNNTAGAIAGGDATTLVETVVGNVAALANRPDVSAPIRKVLSAIELNLAYVRRDIYSIIVLTDDALLQRMGAQFDVRMKDLARDIQVLDEAGLAGGFATEANTISAAFKAYEPLARRAVALAVANTDTAAVRIYTGPFSDARAAVVAEVAKFQSFETGVANGFVTETQSNFESTRTMMLALVGGAIAIGLGMALWIALSISKGLGRAVEVARSIADGDLSRDVEITGRDEITDLQRAFHDMSLKLREVVGQVSTAAENMASGSHELSSSAEQLSEGSTEQAASTEEASASMEEMSANVKQNAENASATEKMAAQSARDAEASGIAVGRALDAMQTIAAKINIVQEIARQTDLLALNAAVEAARAGEHGRGFAVVASEVRKLAERSQAAAAEIGTLSTDTVKVAQEAGAMLAKLVPDIKKTAELVEEITSACREQDVGSTQINQAIQQLDKVTQQNAAASEEVSATSEELSAQAETLQATIAFFRLEAGRTTVAPKATAAPQAAAIDTAVKQLRGKASLMAAATKTKRAEPIVRTVPAKKVANGGFAFAMDGADDQDDAGYRRAS